MSEDERKIISEATKVSISVTSWWHLAIIISTIVWSVAMIKSSIDDTNRVARQALEQSINNDNLLRQLQMQLNIFQQKTEDVFDRYIRDYNDPNRKRR